MSIPILKDASWVRQSFLVSKDSLDLVDYQNRTFTRASLAYTDTTPGGNFAINPPPQFTATADIKVKGPFSKSRGMGRYYYEAIEENSQVVHMRFGQPAFNSLTTFFTGFYNSGAGQLARTGRSTGFFYDLGKAAGFVVSLLAWQLLAVHMLGEAFKFFAQKPTSKFYYSKPNMPLYWHAVTTMVNHIAVNRGIIPRIGGADPLVPSDASATADVMATLSQKLPDVFKFTDKGGIDVYAMANRAQRLANKRYRAMESKLTASSRDDLSRQVQALIAEPMDDTQKQPSLANYIQLWLKSGASKPGGDTGKNDAASEDLRSASGFSDSGWLEFLKAELDDGGAFASFRVNYTGSVQESFSNSIAESELAGKINNMSSSMRSTKFDLAGGNIGDGFLATIAETAGKLVSDFAAGAAAGLNLSGLASLGGSAFVDIPKHWQSSVASLPRASYTINLVSPYGNPISQLVNLHVPLCMLLAAALPISTGKQSYTSPFLVELYDQGRCQTRLGMIDSLSITRGTGNVGFNSDNHVMAIDVSFSIVDMSSVLHMPIAEGFSMTKALTGAAAGAIATVAVPVPGVSAAAAALGAAVANGIFDDDTVYSDYMATLSSLSLPDQIYALRKLKLNMTRNMADFNSWASASRFISEGVGTSVGSVLSAFFPGVARR